MIFVKSLKTVQSMTETAKFFALDEIHKLPGYSSEHNREAGSNNYALNVPKVIVMHVLKNVAGLKNLLCKITITWHIVRNGFG